MQPAPNLTIILYCREQYASSSREDYLAQCSQLIVVDSTPANRTKLPVNVETVEPGAEDGKVAALNEAVKRAKGSHILWLEEGETIPSIPNLQKKTFYAAQISNTEAEGPIHNWQVRLFPTLAQGNLFDGYAIPDLQTRAKALNWKLSEEFLTIQRSGPSILERDINKEIQCENPGSMQAFWQGMKSAENGDFHAAVTEFKQALESDSLFSWNKLALLNSLANALMEIQHSEEARRIAEQSLAITKTQWAPYLTLYQCYNLKGEWEKAYQQLNLYRSVSGRGSAANWDTYLPEAQAAFLMAEIAYSRGNHQKAYTHYQEFYELNAGQISTPVLEKLFIYALELNKKKQAITYFNALFGMDVAQSLSQDKKGRLLEALTMFTDNGWYEFPSSIYQQLVEHHPQNDAIRHGCIRTLVKNNEVEKAQALL